MNDFLRHPLIKQSISNGIKFGLNTINLVLQAANNPHHNFKTIHIAGTNGKGSTSKMLAVCLQENNYKTALFTSPHILKLNERFEINNKKISDDKLIYLLDYIHNIVKTLKKLKKIESITFFEICTACAFLFFAKENVEIAIIETGMGGRLDSTNVLNSKNVIITNINYDHENYLGTTLQEIALEKAGIIHSGSNVILGSIPENIIDIIKKSNNNSVFYTQGKDFNITQTKTSQKLLYTSKHGSFNKIRFNLNLKGIFQTQNCSLVLKTLENMQHQGYLFDKLLIKKALNKIIWPGRFDIISTSPLIIFDAAHNPDAIKKLLLTLNNLYPDKQFTFIAGFMKDKDYTSMIKQITSSSKELILIPLQTNRSLSVKNLAILSKDNHKIKIENSFQHAIDTMRNSQENIPKEINLLVCGSFYILEEAYKWANLNLSEKNLIQNLDIE